MRKIIALLLFQFIQSNLFSQTITDQSEVITQVAKYFEKENVKMFNQIRNELYELEINLLKEKRPESIILNYLDIDHRKFRKIYRETNLVVLSNYYKTITTKDLKEENIAILAIPIFSNDGQKALLYGRFSCGFAFVS